MGSIFNYDGPLMSGLGKLADLIILNLLTLLFCIPIVTIGASITAAHYVALKIRRGEGYVVKNFWKSFKENSIKYLPRTFAMLMISLVPFILVLLSYQLYVFIFMLGFSGPIYVCAMLYDKKFQEIEDIILDKQRETTETEEGLI